MQLRTKRYFLCPSCSKHEFEVEHLFGGTERAEREVGPWQCDECDATWVVRTRPDQGTVDVIRAPQLTWHNWDVLELSGPDKTVIRLVVPGLSFERERKLDKELDRKRSYYEEYTCPTNYFRSATVIASGSREDWGDDDPHGLFRFVATFEHPLRSHQVRSSNETNAIGQQAWKTITKLGRT